MKNFIKRLFSAFLFLLICFFFSIPAYSAVPKVVAANTHGKVAVIRGTETLEVKDGTAILSKDKITTGAGAQVDLVANERWGVRLLGSTDVILQHSSETRTKVKLESGEALFSVNPLSKDQKFYVSTPTAVAAVRGTKFWGRSQPKNIQTPGVFSVREGKLLIYLKDLDFRVELLEGDALDIPAGYAIPSVRAATGAEKEAMKQSEEIPLFLMKADIGNQIELLKKLSRKKDTALSTLPS